MQLLFDLHTHTIASGHAYSTLLENISAAKARGLLAYGFSDHTERMPGTMGNMWFENFKVVPREIDKMKILCGAEVNIYNREGHFDLSEKYCRRMDYIIASLHSPCFDSISEKENTDTLIAAMKNPYVTVIGHPDDGRYPVEYERLAAAAIEHGVLLELNNSSLRPLCTRVNGAENARKLLLACKKLGARIIVNTDSHISFDIGRFDEAIALLNEVDFPEELIANCSIQRLDWVMNKNKC